MKLETTATATDVDPHSLTFLRVPKTWSAPSPDAAAPSGSASALFRARRSPSRDSGVRGSVAVHVILYEVQIYFLKGCAGRVLAVLS